MFWFFVLLAFVMVVIIANSDSEKKEEENLLDLWEIKEVKLSFKDKVKSGFVDFKKTLLD